MKKSFLSTTRVLLVSLATLSTVFAFSACKKEKEETKAPVSTTAPAISTVAPIIEITYDENEFIVDGTTIVKYIGNGGKVEIPEKITAIGDMAFSGRSDVESVVFTKDVVSIGEKAFENCTGLSSDFSIPSNLGYLGDYAFAGCTGITKVLIEAKPITVGTHIFENCTSLEDVTIPKTFGYIPAYAFTGCSSLKTLNVATEITDIQDYAFSGCSSLEKITLPSKLATVGNYVFKGCSKLSEIEYSKSLENIGFGAFNDTKWFENTIATQKENPATSPEATDDSNKYVFIGNDVIIYYIDDSADNSKITLNIPSKAYAIASGAFSHCIAKIENVNFGETSNMQIINAGVFKDATALTSFNVPSKVTTINDDLFNGCVNLKDFIFPNKVTYIGNNAFKNCSKLVFTNESGEDVKQLPNDVTMIGDYAFYGCKALTNINLPDAITDLGDYAFKDCNNISKFVIPLGLKNIGIQAFDNTKWYNDLSVHEVAPTENIFHVYGDGVLIKADIINNAEIIIPEDVKSIASFTFTNWGQIKDREFYNSTLPKSITIPNGVTSIGDYAFYFCENLETVFISETVTSIGEKAFYGCKNLTVINIPSSITEIKDYAFYGCSALSEIVLPEKLTSIGDYAFYNCYNLSDINIPATVNNIGAFAFTNTGWFHYNTDKELIVGDGVLLKSNSTDLDVVLSNNVKSIVGGAFETRDINSITLPATVTNIPNYAFSGCVNLTKVTAKGAITSIGSRAFNGCQKITEFNAGNANVAADAYENSSLSK